MMAGAAPTWAMAVAALAVLSLILFGAAVRSGRWGAWLAGYAAILLAVAIALVSNHERVGPAGDPAPPSPAAATQLSREYGVLDPVDRRPGSGEVT
jgi:hypothetical protein